MTTTRLSQEALLREKQTVRRRLLERRNGLDPEARRQASEAITAHLLVLPAFREASCLHCFISLPGEVETLGLLEAVSGEGKTLCVPVIEEGRLHSVYWRPGEPLAPGHFNVPEPPPGSRVACPIENIDLVLLPGVGFDRSGGRLGYGRGYYDTFLADLSLARTKAGKPPAQGVGLAFGCQIVAEIPMGDHDTRTDGVITEEGFMAASNPMEDA